MGQKEKCVAYIKRRLRGYRRIYLAIFLQRYLKAKAPQTNGCLPTRKFVTLKNLSTARMAVYTEAQEAKNTSIIPFSQDDPTVFERECAGHEVPLPPILTAIYRFPFLSLTKPFLKKSAMKIPMEASIDDWSKRLNQAKRD
ncbi:hypothetical protein TNCV_1197051 [Trichonephila clavipes]|uniref:Uncharacterized protein n=1 Tax=Trichonephila clavipes TaxID=2585209 RepID=A0A8X6S041_TRICX|nr:hypothetical protein TNCV_1197051 [Trichonephila clavipes]